MYISQAPASPASAGTNDDAVFVADTPALSTTLTGAIWGFNAASQATLAVVFGVMLLLTPLKWVAALAFGYALWEVFQLVSSIALMQRKDWGRRSVRGAMIARSLLFCVVVPYQVYDAARVWRLLDGNDVAQILVGAISAILVVGLVFFVAQVWAIFHLGKATVQSEFLR